MKLPGGVSRSFEGRLRPGLALGFQRATIPNGIAGFGLKGVQKAGVVIVMQLNNGYGDILQKYQITMNVNKVTNHHRVSANTLLTRIRSANSPNVRTLHTSEKRLNLFAGPNEIQST